MVVVSHLFFFFDKKFGESVTRYESHPPSLELSISRQPPLRRKIYNESSFTQTEISILCELLKISSGDEIKEIFFTDIVE